LTSFLAFLCFYFVKLIIDFCVHLNKETKSFCDYVVVSGYGRTVLLTPPPPFLSRNTLLESWISILHLRFGETIVHTAFVHKCQEKDRNDAGYKHTENTQKDKMVSIHLPSALFLLIQHIITILTTCFLGTWLSTKPGEGDQKRPQDKPYFAGVKLNPGEVSISREPAGRWHRVHGRETLAVCTVHTEAEWKETVKETKGSI